VSEDTGPDPLEAAEAFVAELQRWRDARGLATRALSKRMSYDSSYVGKVGSGSAWPTEDFAKRADEVLRAGGGGRAWYEPGRTGRRRLGKRVGAIPRGFESCILRP